MAKLVSTVCEDYPCCGHGPPPLGDDGGCPHVYDDGKERWPCAGCGALLPWKNNSALCAACVQRVHNDERLPLDVDDDW
jgi:hypothetical protein